MGFQRLQEDFCKSDNMNVSGQTNGINTPTKSTENTSGSVTQGTSQQLGLPTSPTMTYFVEVFLAKVSVLLEREGDLTTQGEHYSLTSLGFSRKNNQDCVYWKTSKDCYLMTMAELSKPSSPRLLNWGMTSNGKCLTARISESPRIGKECSLSDVLEEQIDHKYFLSENLTQKLLNYRDTSQTPLPPDMSKPKP